jgi:hypothetical protein
MQVLAGNVIIYYVLKVYYISKTKSVFWSVLFWTSHAKHLFYKRTLHYYRVHVSFFFLYLVHQGVKNDVSYKAVLLAELCGVIVVISSSCLRGHHFEFLPGNWLSWHGFPQSLKPHARRVFFNANHIHFLPLAIYSHPVISHLIAYKLCSPHSVIKQRMFPQTRIFWLMLHVFTAPFLSLHIKLIHDKERLHRQHFFS